MPRMRSDSHRETTTSLACHSNRQSDTAANAKHNLGLKKASLFISEARVDQGSQMKRFRPRAQGRGFPIKKPTCHIMIEVKQKS